MNKANKHVVPTPEGGWAVRSSGSARVAKIFDTRREALAYGRNAAKKSKGDLFIHREDGTVEQKRCYGGSSGPVRGKS